MVVGQALTPSTFLTTVDRARLKAVFEAALPVTDVVNAHYSILGLKMLGAPIPNAQVQSVLKHCVFSPNAHVQSVLNYIVFISKCNYAQCFEIYWVYSSNAQVQSLLKNILFSPNAQV